MKHRLLKNLFLFLIIVLAPLSLSASGTMVRYTSPTGLYEVIVPDNYVVDKTPFRIGSKRVVYKTELKAIQDQRPYKNSVKQHFIKTFQTLGPTLTREEKNNLILSHLNSYADFYADKNGIVIERKNNLPSLSQTGGEILISFEDPTLGPQTLKARVLFSDVTKMEQVLLGPPDIMESYRSKSYFNSLIFNSGVTFHDDDVRADWIKKQSPLGIFTTYLPKKTDPYVPGDPKYYNSKRSEVVSIDFFDPIRSHKLRYNIYGYEFGRNLDYNNSKEVLHKRHIQNFEVLSDRFEIEEYMLGKSKAMRTAFRIYADSRNDEMDFVALKVQFRGKYMIVQEIIGPQSLVQSSLAKNITAQVVFHPGVALSLKNRP